MTGAEMLDKLHAMARIVENAPPGIEFLSGEIVEKHLRDSSTIYLKNGIEAFREPVGFLYHTANFNWFGFQVEGILVCQAFPREGGQQS